LKYFHKITPPFTQHSSSKWPAELVILSQISQLTGPPLHSGKKALW